MTFDVPISILSAFGASSIAFFGWLARRTLAHQGQITHLDEKIDRLIDAIVKRIDRMEEHHREDMKEMKESHKEMDAKWDKSIQHMDAKWERLFERLLIKDQQKEN